MRAIAVQMIPVDNILVEHPREHSKRAFQSLCESVFEVGLKRPIIVRPSTRQSGAKQYLLVHGQARLEVFKLLGQPNIPAIVRRASDQAAWLMSLVGNSARRDRTRYELLIEIDRLRKQFDDVEVARRLGKSTDYIRDLGNLWDAGEQRLAAAVEAGVFPLALAIEIARSADRQVRKIVDRYCRVGALRGNARATVRRILRQRSENGPGLSKRSKRSYGRHPSGHNTVRPNEVIQTFKREAGKQRAFIERALTAERKLICARRAFSVLVGDDNFLNLLRAEGIRTIPSCLLADRKRGS